MNAFGNGAFEEVDLTQSDWRPYKKRKRGHGHQGCGGTEERLCADAMRRQPSASQGESPQGKPNKGPTFWSWAQASESETIKFCS